MTSRFAFSDPQKGWLRMHAARMLKKIGPFFFHFCFQQKTIRHVSCEFNRSVDTQLFKLASCVITGRAFSIISPAILSSGRWLLWMLPGSTRRKYLQPWFPVWAIRPIPFRTRKQQSVRTWGAGCTTRNRKFAYSSSRATGSSRVTITQEDIFIFIFKSSFLLSSLPRRSLHPQRSSGQHVVTSVVPSPPGYVPLFFVAHRFPAFPQLADFYRMNVVDSHSRAFR